MTHKRSIPLPKSMCLAKVLCAVFPLFYAVAAEEVCDRDQCKQSREAAPSAIFSELKASSSEFDDTSWLQSRHQAHAGPRTLSASANLDVAGLEGTTGQKLRLGAAGLRSPSADRWWLLLSVVVATGFTICCAGVIAACVRRFSDAPRQQPSFTSSDSCGSSETSVKRREFENVERCLFVKSLRGMYRQTAAPAPVGFNILDPDGNPMIQAFVSPPEEKSEMAPDTATPAWLTGRPAASASSDEAGPSTAPLVTLRALPFAQRSSGSNRRGEGQLLACCRCDAKAEGQANHMNVYDADDKLYGRLTPGNVGGATGAGGRRHILTSTRSKTRLVFDGDVQTMAMSVATDRGERLADSAPGQLPYEPSEPFYCLRVLGSADALLVLCSLLAIEADDIFTTSRRLATAEPPVAG